MVCRKFRPSHSANLGVEHVMLETTWVSSKGQIFRAVYIVAVYILFTNLQNFPSTSGPCLCKFNIVKYSVMVNNNTVKINNVKIQYYFPAQIFDAIKPSIDKIIL